MKLEKYKFIPLVPVTKVIRRRSIEAPKVHTHPLYGPAIAPNEKINFLANISSKSNNPNYVYSIVTQLFLTALNIEPLMLPENGWRRARTLHFLRIQVAECTMNNRSVVNVLFWWRKCNQVKRGDHVFPMKPRSNCAALPTPGSKTTIHKLQPIIIHQIIH